ncbi:MAG: cellobiose phosphorylase [Lachnospiraceae bacterium]|nr:cellobiose phosphorylase [Lachnospiraceae bacterium]
MRRFVQEEEFEISGEHLSPELYFPLAGEMGLKSAITPYGKGDAKTDQNHFLLAPASVLDLSETNLGRNFWFCCKGREAWSLFGESAWQKALEFTEDEEEVTFRAGYMWQKVTRCSDVLNLKGEVTSFIPFGENTEIHICTVENTGKQPVTGTMVSAIPIYGRSADNIRDHRHVTSLLHRCRITGKGIHVTPTMSFDERGHGKNDVSYFVEGMSEEGLYPEKFIPVLKDFTGEGSLLRPQALEEGEGFTGYCKAGEEVQGQEMTGTLRFPEITLQPGETKTYLFFAGIGEGAGDYHNLEDVTRELEKTRTYWKKKVNVSVETGDPEFDGFMRWVAFQPELRRIYGCSFLPHHDYGKGGRGWRDLWQDCLALLLMNPDGVHHMLLGNFAGERIDGTNATIIGEKPGEFKADRNAIARVWMDHGAWPFLTCELYFHQTGDHSLLNEKAPYFKDQLIFRGEKQKTTTDPDTRLRDCTGNIYEGTVLEHLLVQNLTAYWEVGDHGHIRLRNADWNDALDMAPDKGESVAFTNFYGRNLLHLADLLDKEYPMGEMIPICKELEILLQDGEESPLQRRQVLRNYLEQVQDTVSGEILKIPVERLAGNLRRKGMQLLMHVRKKEWIDLGEKGYYNGYYDDNRRALEGIRDGREHMMLTSQVFAILAGTATVDQVKAITRCADSLLYDQACGGYRLNTDFKEVKMDMGRMFGFAYGEKENGAVFSHMAVMYGNALYERGFVKEGYKALDALYRQSMNQQVSKIYPGLPEYFGYKGRGLYHYLTGSASWYLMTVMNRMFGVRGVDGDLCLEPGLLRKQFHAGHTARISCRFGEIRWKITYENPEDKEYGDYGIREVYLDEEKLSAESLASCEGKEDDTKARAVIIPLQKIRTLNECITHHIRVVLG